MEMRIGILTVSDRCSRGEEQDLSGPFIAGWATEHLGACATEHLGACVVRQEIVPDERPDIARTLAAWCDAGNIDLILTTGGTGFAPRDVTPEATRDVIEREAPGLAEAMRSAGLAVTPRAMLSRAIAGIRQHTLIVNMPGSPKAVREYLEVLAPALPHGIEILKGTPEAYPGKE